MPILNITINESTLYDQISKLRTGTRRRLLRRTKKQFKESLSNYNQLQELSSDEHRQSIYNKVINLKIKLSIINNLIIWFDDDPASKFTSIYCQACKNESHELTYIKSII
jgi:hypothetical protein